MDVTDHRGFFDMPMYVRQETWMEKGDGRYDMVKVRTWVDNALMVEDRLSLARQAQGPDLKLEMLGDNHFRIYRRIPNGMLVEESAVNVDAGRFYSQTIGPHPEVFS